MERSSKDFEMTKGLVTFLANLTLLAATASANDWMSDYGAALKAAKAEGKPLVVVIENPSDRAVRFEEASLTAEQPSSQLLARYILCRVDASTAYGQAVAKAFRATSLPLTSIIDKTAAVQIFVQQGPLSAAQWRAALATHQSGAKPEPVICST